MNEEEKPRVVKLEEFGGEIGDIVTIEGIFKPNTKSGKYTDKLQKFMYMGDSYIVDTIFYIDYRSLSRKLYKLTSIFLLVNFIKELLF